MRALVFFGKFHREADAREYRLEAALLCLDKEGQVHVLHADMLDGNASFIRAALYILHQISLVS